MTARLGPQEQEGAQPPRPVTELPLASPGLAEFIRPFDAQSTAHQDVWACVFHAGDVPTSFAALTILKMPLLPPDGPADDEQPSLLAECRIEIAPFHLTPRSASPDPTTPRSASPDPTTPP